MNELMPVFPGLDSRSDYWIPMSRVVKSALIIISESNEDCNLVFYFVRHVERYAFFHEN